MKLGEKVKKRRLELGLSQDELAQRMGYSSRTSINKIENGRPCSQKIIKRLAEALRLDEAYLMGIEVTMETAVEQAQFDAYIAKDKDVQGMLRKFVALPEDKKKAVKEFIDKLFNEFFNG